MDTQLVDAETVYSTPDGRLAGLSAAQELVARYWVIRPGQGPAQTVGMNKGPMPTVTAVTPTVAAVVNHGRWTVHCPFCPSAAYASRDDHRFFCCDCANNATGQWLAVTWPDDAAGIEQALLARPDETTRNWTPDETLDDLLAENEAQGVGS